jgi:hypothetical protein
VSKQTVLAVAVAVGLATLATLWLGLRALRPEPRGAATPAAVPSSRVEARRETSPAVVLDAAALSSGGVAVATAERARGDGELEAYGRVLDPLPLAESVLARAAARTALTVARREYERVGALNRNDANASARELEGAEAAFHRAELDLAGAEARLASTWGVELARRSDLDGLARALAERRAGLARLDLPAGEEVAELPAAARVSAAARDGDTFEGKVLGIAPTTDPVAQSQGFLVLLEPGPPPGTVLAARLAFRERAAEGVRLPRSSVVWHEGEAYVYAARGGGRFERRAVTLKGDRDGDWLATGEVAPGDSIVVSGALLLLSTEQLGEPAGD